MWYCSVEEGRFCWACLLCGEGHEYIPLTAGCAPCSLLQPYIDRQTRLLPHLPCTLPQPRLGSPTLSPSLPPTSSLAPTSLALPTSLSSSTWDLVEVTPVRIPPHLPLHVQTGDYHRIKASTFSLPHLFSHFWLEENVGFHDVLPFGAARNPLCQFGAVAVNLARIVPVITTWGRVFAPSIRVQQWSLCGPQNDLPG